MEHTSEMETVLLRFLPWNPFSATLLTPLTSFGGRSFFPNQEKTFTPLSFKINPFLQTMLTRGDAHAKVRR